MAVTVTSCPEALHSIPPVLWLKLFSPPLLQCSLGLVAVCVVGASDADVSSGAEHSAFSSQLRISLLIWFLRPRLREARVSQHQELSRHGNFGPKHQILGSGIVLWTQPTLGLFISEFPAV